MSLPAVQTFFIPAVTVNVPGFIINNLDGTGLRIEWSIERDNTNKPDSGEIRIFNLSPVVAGVIFETWQALNAAGLGTGMLLIFSLGWNRIPKTVFIGDVWDMVPSFRTPTDTITIFRLGDNNRPQRDAVVGRDWHAVKIDIVLDYLVSLPMAPDDAGGGGLGLFYPPESKALVAAAAAELPQQTWGNIPKGANVRDAIDIIMDTLGLEWRVSNGEFVVLRGGIIARPGPILTPGTGLISYNKRNDGGIELTSLAVPETEPGIQIQVLDNLFKPVGEIAYRVETVRFAGSTDEDSVMDVTAAKARVV